MKNLFNWCEGVKTKKKFKFMVNKEQSSDVSLAPDEVSGKLNSSSTIINDIKKLWECTLYMEIFSKASRIEEPV